MRQCVYIRDRGENGKNAKGVLLLLFGRKKLAKCMFEPVRVRAFFVIALVTDGSLS